MNWIVRGGSIAVGYEFHPLNANPFQDNACTATHSLDEAASTSDPSATAASPVGLATAAGSGSAPAGRSRPRSPPRQHRPTRQTLAVTFDADNPGLWMVHCHNIYHAEAGMMTLLGYRK